MNFSEIVLNQKMGAVEVCTDPAWLGSIFIRKLGSAGSGLYSFWAEPNLHSFLSEPAGLHPFRLIFPEDSGRAKPIFCFEERVGLRMTFPCVISGQIYSLLVKKVNDKAIFHCHIFCFVCN